MLRPFLRLWFVLAQALAQSTNCTTRDQPNPIAFNYTDGASGTLNSTMAILPITLADARRIIPSKWPILERAYRKLLPDFPPGMYPVFLQAVHDHDVGVAAYGISIPDFSRASFSFPFLDLLGDGYSSFQWTPSQFLTEGSVSIPSAQSFGQIVYPAVFDPPCDAYRALPHGGTYVAARGTNESVFMELEFRRMDSGTGSVYPIQFWKNVTNQPMFFTNASLCDGLVRLWNTPVTEGRFAPVPVKGTIRANAPPMEPLYQAQEVYGLQVDTAFVEYSTVGCKSLEGYSGTGPGD